MDDEEDTGNEALSLFVLELAAFDPKNIRDDVNGDAVDAFRFSSFCDGAGSDGEQGPHQGGV